jgi:HD superfamily phosphohydrolase
MAETVFRDAVHQDISFDEREMGVIDTPQIQRMRGIRQLGLAHLLYPSANHTRFEHSLGVAHMADQIMNAVAKSKNGDSLQPEERRFTRALAIVHDVGHVPFGHTLEDERPVFPVEQHHDDDARLDILLRNTELGSALQNLGDDIGRSDIVGDIIRIMKLTHAEKDGANGTQAREVMFADIVGNTICADLLDYLIRDTYFTGLQHRYDRRLLSAFKIQNDQIYLDLDDGGMLHHSVFSEVMGLLRLRYTLGERVYYHPIKNVASAMVSKAVELAGLSHRAVVGLRDDDFLYVLEHAHEYKSLEGEPIENPVRVAEIARMLRWRRFYIPAYVIRGDDAAFYAEQLVSEYHEAKGVEKRKTAEQELAAAIGVDPSQIIIFCPDNKMSAKPALVRVRWPMNPNIERLQELCDKRRGTDCQVANDEIGQLRTKHAALWRMTVFLHPEASEKKGALQAACAELFYGIPDYRLTRASISHRPSNGQGVVEESVKQKEPVVSSPEPRKKQPPLFVDREVVATIRSRLTKLTRRVDRTIVDNEMARLEREVEARGDEYGSRLLSMFGNEISKLEKFEQNQLTEVKLRQLLTRILEMAQDG